MTSQLFGGFGGDSSVFGEQSGEAPAAGSSRAFPFDAVGALAWPAGQVRRLHKTSTLLSLTLRAKQSEPNRGPHREHQPFNFGFCDFTPFDAQVQPFGSPGLTEQQVQNLRVWSANIGRISSVSDIIILQGILKAREEAITSRFPSLPSNKYQHEFVGEAHLLDEAATSTCQTQLFPIIGAHKGYEVHHHNTPKTFGNSSNVVRGTQHDSRPEILKYDHRTSGIGNDQEVQDGPSDVARLLQATGPGLSNETNIPLQMPPMNHSSRGKEPQSTGDIVMDLVTQHNVPLAHQPSVAAQVRSRVGLCHN
jgi:hypothetical protein